MNGLWAASWLYPVCYSIYQRIHHKLEKPITFTWTDQLRAMLYPGDPTSLDTFLMHPNNRFHLII